MSSRLPLVLLPGLLCDAALWQHQIRALSDSAAPQVAETHHHGTLEAIAHDVLAAAPPRFALAGLSMGGYVAFEILRQAPERVLKLQVGYTYFDQPGVNAPGNATPLAKNQIDAALTFNF